MYPAALLYGAPEVRFDSFTCFDHVEPPFDVDVYHVLNAPVRSSCHARRKSFATGPAAIWGKLLSPFALISVGAPHVTPSAEVLTYKLFGPFATVEKVYAAARRPA